MEEFMELTYKNIKEISQERLVDLFKSVEWESANYPAQLVQAIKNYGSVFSAWDNAFSYTHLRSHETYQHLVLRLGV